jgi:hypothetical protein
MCIVHSTLRDATTPYTERCNKQIRMKIYPFDKLLKCDLVIDAVYDGCNNVILWINMFKGVIIFVSL